MKQELKRCDCGYFPEIVYFPNGNNSISINSDNYIVKCYHCNKQTTLSISEENAIIKWNNYYTTQEYKVSVIYYRNIKSITSSTVINIKARNESELEQIIKEKFPHILKWTVLT